MQLTVQTWAEYM